MCITVKLTRTAAIPDASLYETTSPKYFGHDGSCSIKIILSSKIFLLELLSKFSKLIKSIAVAGPNSICN
jgi:hypothetical protein